MYRPTESAGNILYEIKRNNKNNITANNDRKVGKLTQFLKSVLKVYIP
jgi:hypothetical protein